MHLTAHFVADAAARHAVARQHSASARAERQSTGSGLIIDSSGLVVTNCHVVHDAVEDGHVKVTLSDGLTELDGVVQDVDVTADIALVRDPAAAARRRQARQLGLPSASS